MEDNKNTVVLEDVLDSEIDDIWELFFPYILQEQEKLRKLEQPEQSKPRRYLRFLTM